MDSFSNIMKFDDVLNYINDGDDERALSILSSLTPQMHDDFLYCHLYICCLINTGHFSEAISFLKTKSPMPLYNDLLCRIYNLTNNENAEIELQVISAKQRIKSKKYVVSVINKLIGKNSNRYNLIAFELARNLTDVHPDFSLGWQLLAKLAMYTDNWEQAELAYLKLLSMDEGNENILNDYESLLARKTIAPSFSEKNIGTAQRKKSVSNKGAIKKRYVMARYPMKDELITSFRDVFFKHVAVEFNSNPPVFMPHDKFVTFGSCFASNVAAELKSQGKNVWHIPIGEDVNNTYTNKLFWQWVCGHELGADIENKIFKLLNVSRCEVLQKIKDAKCFIYTLGLGAAFFSKNTGEVLVPDSDWVGTRALMDHGEFKTTSVGDNYRNILEIISLIREVNVGAQIIITLSPVPLLATFERHSAVIADCLSKSVLRVAINEVMNDKIDAVYYWPSFEAVRWLAPHIGKFYGSDDGVSRHINENIISDIISVFVDSVTMRDC